MAQGDVQRLAHNRPPPKAARIAERVASVQRDSGECIEEADDHPKEVQPLNAGFFVLEAMRQQRTPEAR